MNLISRIPKDFYKVFGSKYMEFYMQFLVAVYEESSQSYSLLGLTEGECQAIMNEQLARMTLDWSEERFDEEGELLTRSNMAMISLRHFEDWGWLRRDYDESIVSCMWSCSVIFIVMRTARSARVCWQCTVTFIHIVRIGRRIMIS